MASEITLQSGGRWAISKIIRNVRGNWTTTVSQNKLAPVIHNYFPPQNIDGTYAGEYALVWLDGNVKTPDADTILLPNLVLDDTLVKLSSVNQNTLKSNLGDRFPGYSYLDYKNEAISVADFDASLYDSNIPFKQVLQDIYKFLQHSSYRSKPVGETTHNTEYTDNYDTDPATRWTARLNTFSYDSVNGEVSTVGT